MKTLYLLGGLLFSGKTTLPARSLSGGGFFDLPPAYPSAALTPFPSDGLKTRLARQPGRRPARAWQVPHLRRIKTSKLTGHERGEQPGDDGHSTADGKVVLETVS